MKIIYPILVYYYYSIRFYGIYTDKEGWDFLVTEFLTRGSLRDVLMEERDNYTSIQLLDLYVFNVEYSLFLSFLLISICLL